MKLFTLKKLATISVAFLLFVISITTAFGQNNTKPNVVIIFTDDIGFADIGAYGNTQIPTPNMDALANKGQKFTNAYTTAATCTPSRFSLLTGRYNWRQNGTGVAAGNAGLVIDTTIQTMPEMFQTAGYTTCMIGKWHLGLGGKTGPNWNSTIYPGVKESGFDYAFYMPSTNDRVPTVFIDQNKVLNLDPNDPLEVDYRKPIGNEPTGKDHPELLNMHPSHGHNQTIVNGISRIGYMSGGKAAWWRDQDIADIITQKAVEFIEEHKAKPFFMYYNPHDIHVPRTPHERFVGKSGHGLRGDALMELDFNVGEVVKALEKAGVANNTLIILSSDNGPVIDDGYHDKSVEELGTLTPWGPYRGGKYSIFEAGTHVPFVTVWPGTIKPGVNPALLSQVDVFASLAKLINGNIETGQAIDSRNQLKSLLGKDTKGRAYIIQNAGSNAIRKGQWKYIAAANRTVVLMKEVNIEPGLTTEEQLYNLATDPGEKNNVAASNPKKLAELKALLLQVTSSAADGDKR